MNFKPKNGKIHILSRQLTKQPILVWYKKSLQVERILFDFFFVRAHFFKNMEYFEEVGMKNYYFFFSLRADQ